MNNDCILTYKLIHYSEGKSSAGNKFKRFRDGESLILKLA